MAQRRGRPHGTSPAGRRHIDYSGPFRDGRTKVMERLHNRDCRVTGRDRHGAPARRGVSRRCAGLPPSGLRFTLIEMVVVVALIAILASMLMPALNMVRRRAREAATATEIANIEVAMTSYFQDEARYPGDDYGAGDRARQAGQALVRSLDERGYFDFDPGRLTDESIDGDGGGDYVFINRFGGDAYYRFRENYDREEPCFDEEGNRRYADGEGWSAAVEDWNVSYVNRNSVDIWTADQVEGKELDFVDWWLEEGANFTAACEVTVDGEAMAVPTWETLRGIEDTRRRYRTISNW